VHKDALPNQGHIAISKMASENRRIIVVTQNIDGLHSKAGCTEVIELHGSVYKNYCIDCGESYNLNYLLEYNGIIPKCKKCEGIIRPDVTMYEEPLEQDVLISAINHIEDADFLFAIGSSLTVQPAAGLLSYFRGENFVIINMQPTYYDEKADHVIRESCGNVLKKIAGGLYE